MLISWRGTNLRFGEWCCLDSVFGFFGGPNHTIHLRRRCSPGSLGAPFIKKHYQLCRVQVHVNGSIAGQVRSQPKTHTTFLGPEKKKNKVAFFLDAKSDGKYPPWKSSKPTNFKISSPLEVFVINPY